MDDFRELKQDVKEIKEVVVEMSKQQAVDHHILKEHEARSTALKQQLDFYKVEIDNKLQPIVAHVSVVKKIMGLAGAVGVYTLAAWMRHILHF